MLFYEPDTRYANTNFSFPYLTHGETGGGGIFIKRLRFIILEKKNINYCPRSYCALTFNILYVYAFFRYEKNKIKCFRCNYYECERRQRFKRKMKDLFRN